MRFFYFFRTIIFDIKGIVQVFTGILSQRIQE
jgi:hypothetical protein